MLTSYTLNPMDLISYFNILLKNWLDFLCMCDLWHRGIYLLTLRNEKQNSIFAHLSQ